MFKFRNFFWSIFFFAIAISSETLAAPLKVGIPVKDSEPFVIQQEEKIEGMIVDIWDRIAQEKAIDYEWVPQDNYELAIDAVNQGEIDILVGPISMTPGRIKKVEFTIPISELEIVVVTQSEPPTLWDRLKPFLGLAAISSLGILIVSVFIVGNLIWLAERKVNSEHFPEDYRHGLRNGMWFAMVTLTTVGYGDFAPVSNLGRLISAIWMLITLLALSSITAGLASAITISLSSQSSPRFTTEKDLRGAKIAAVKGWASTVWADYHGADTVEVQTYEEALSLVMEDKAEGLIDNDANFTYYISQNPELNLAMADISLATDLYGFALPFDSELTRDLNSIIMRMRQDGEIKTLEDIWFYK